MNFQDTTSSFTSLCAAVFCFTNDLYSAKGLCGSNGN